MCEKDVFKASESKKYSICYEQPDQPGRIKFYKTSESLEKAERERLELLRDFPDCDIRIREERSKVSWYKYT